MSSLDNMVGWFPHTQLIILAALVGLLIVVVIRELFRGKKKQHEHLPWYRKRNYKGNLTEAEKHQLDAFRMQEKHPAAEYESLPQEVQSYINGLELENYDKKQEALVLPALLCSGLGAYFLIRCIFGYDEGSFFRYAVSIALLVPPWIWYSIKWKQNADEFLPETWPSPTDEALMREWELDYIANKRRSKRQSSYQLWITKEPDGIKSDNAAIDVWIRKWCEQNPTKLLADVALAFVWDQRKDYLEALFARQQTR